MSAAETHLQDGKQQVALDTVYSTSSSDKRMQYMLHSGLCSDVVSPTGGHTAGAVLLGIVVTLQGTAAAFLPRYTVKAHVGVCNRIVWWSRESTDPDTQIWTFPA